MSGASLSTGWPMAAESVIHHPDLDVVFIYFIVFMETAAFNRARTPDCVCARVYMRLQIGETYGLTRPIISQIKNCKDENTNITTNAHVSVFRNTARVVPMRGYCQCGAQ